MLLSLLKILLFFAVVLAVALGAIHLAENGQPLMLTYDGTEYTLGPVTALVALAVLVVLGWAALRLVGLLVAFLRFLMGDETAINRYFARSRQRKGYDALSEGMLAVASGEGKLAQDKAAKAAKYLDQPHVTDLLAAQAAEVAGDSATAERVYRRLLGDDRTRFVGIRGLMRQELDKGHTAKALKLAEKAYALKPRHGEVQDTLLQLQAREHDWKGARQVLKDKRRQGQLPKDVHIRRDAVLALQEAADVLAHGNNISAREAAISAAAASPDLVPAAVLAARSYIAKGDMRNASRVLQKTWSVQPHPAIAAAYAEIAPDEAPQARQRRFEDLIRKNPEHEEAHLLKAELALAAEDFPAARRALGKLAETHPTTRTLSIMAAIERGEGADDAVVRGWLARALTASRGPQWVCDKCHNVMAEWAPVCDSCGGFDTLTWREPDSARNAAASVSPTGAEMLPLIVGRPAGSADHVTRTFAEADAYAEGADDAARPVGTTPLAQPGMVTPDDLDAPTPRGPARPAPRPASGARPVQPGMVAPEPDYEPSSTVTDPEVSSPPRTVPRQPSRPAPDAAARPDEADDAHPIPTAESGVVEAQATYLPVRPDVEPPETDLSGTPDGGAKKR